VLKVEDVLQVVQEFVGRLKGSPPGAISPETPLLQEGHVDSFGLIELIGELEDRLEMELRGQLIPEDFESVRVLHQRLLDISG
jgi:acyl carrier protein